MLKNSYDECADLLSKEFPDEFDLEDAIKLLTEKGEEENDVRFLLASLMKNGHLDYVGTRGYGWVR